MGRPGWPELLLILLVVLLLFGSKRLPDLSRSVGRSLRIFKSETKALRDDDDEEPTSPDAAADAPRAALAAGSGHGADAGRSPSSERTAPGSPARTPEGSETR